MRKMRKTWRHINLVARSKKKSREKNPFRLRGLEALWLKLTPSRHTTSTRLDGKRIWLTDPYWFVLNHKEIFDDQVYKFKAKRQNPYIIDCGSNIGLSIIYFNFLYPNSRIVGIEPDPEIFKFLIQNLKQFKSSNLELIQKAVWTSNDTLYFKQDGSLGGRIVGRDDGKKIIQVQTIRLRDLLCEPVDFLKIDIEGAEYDVLMDIQDKLSQVEHLFLEYHGGANEPQNLHEILGVISAAGYRYHIKEAKPVRHPFISEERDTVYDLQLNIYAFRD